MAGFDPTIIDIEDSQFDIIAVVRPGLSPIKSVTLSQNQGPFSLSMLLSEVLPNGDLMYRTTFNFPRGSIPTNTTLGFLWGENPGELNITVIDEAESKHSFPFVEFINAPEVESKVEPPTPVLQSPQPIRRIGPQVLAAGLDPPLIDRGDDRFDVVAIVRPGATDISAVTVSFNDGSFSLSMSKDFTLPNGDEFWRATFNFPRGSIPLNTKIGFLWGDKPKELNITVIDKAQQKHSFPNLVVTNAPKLE